MNKIKKTVLGMTITLAIVSVGLTNGCKDEKEVKVTEEINTEITPVPVVVPDKDVNVNVHVDNPAQPATDTKRTEVTNVTVKPDNTALNNQIASVNANMKKLQAEVNSANAQTKAQLNSQIQQMNLEKLRLQEQIKSFEIKTRDQQLEKTKQEFVQLTQARIDNFEKKMDTLKDKVNYLESTERTEVDQKVTQMEEQKDFLVKKMTALDTTIDIRTFNTIRTQIDTMMADLEKNYSRLINDRVSLR